MTAIDESVPKTLVVAVAVALVCSALVSSAVYLLRPMQAAYGALERNRAIVTAAGDLGANAGDQEIVAAFLALESKVFDLRTGIQSDLYDAHTYDHWETKADLPGEYVPIYFKLDKAALERVVLPIHGKGMWSTLYGYLALDADLNTVMRLVIYQHGETPGIGDLVQDPQWLAHWRGKKIHDDNGALQIAVTTDTGVPNQHRVDSITGATVTSKAVGSMVRHWMGANGYALVIAQLKRERDFEGESQ